jgi:hypothetical protein
MFAKACRYLARVRPPSVAPVANWRMTMDREAMSNATNRGLDLGGDLTAVTDQERADFANFYTGLLGHRHRGLEYLLEQDPVTLKLYRRYSDTATPGNYEGETRLFVFGFLPFYAVIGYDIGVRYLLHTRQRLGMTKEQIFEGIAIAFMVCGPAGSETIARALEDYEWLEPDRPARFPDGWEADPNAFRSGLDFENPDLSPSEAEALRDWYATNLGEVPRYVSFLMTHRPRMIKAYRARFENCVNVLPKQFMPTTLLHYHTSQGFGPGIRENLLLARAWGVSKHHALNAMGSASLQGVDLFSVVDEVASDIFTDWTD